MRLAALEAFGINDQIISIWEKYPYNVIYYPDVPSFLFL